MSAIILALVCGHEVPVTLSSRPLREIVGEALASRGYSMDSGETWEIRYENGVLINDLSRPADSYGMAHGALLFVTPPVGVNG